MAEEQEESGTALQLLMQHLASVKLESEERAFHLTSQIDRLNAALEESAEKQQRLQDELELRLGLIDELKRQQSTKHRIETLDDWKAMVQQLNADRARLAEEVEALRGERAKLLTELRKSVMEGSAAASASASAAAAAAAAAAGGAAKEDEDKDPAGGGATRAGALALLSSAGLGVNGGGEVAAEAAEQEALRAELARVKQQCQELELRNRRSELEVQRLRDEVRRRQGIGTGGGRGQGGGILYSLGNFFFGGSSSSPKRTQQHPVLQV